MAYGSALMFQSLGQSLGNLGSEISRAALINQQQLRQDKRDEVADMMAAKRLGVEEQRLAETRAHNAAMLENAAQAREAARIEAEAGRAWREEEGGRERDWRAGQGAIERAARLAEFTATQEAGALANLQRQNIDLANLGQGKERLDLYGQSLLPKRDRSYDDWPSYVRAADRESRETGIPLNMDNLRTRWDVLQTAIGTGGGLPDAGGDTPPGGGGIPGVPNPPIPRIVSGGAPGAAPQGAGAQINFGQPMDPFAKYKEEENLFSPRPMDSSFRRGY